MCIAEARTSSSRSSSTPYRNSICKWELVDAAFVEDLLGGEEFGLVLRKASLGDPSLIALVCGPIGRFFGAYLRD